MNKAEKIRMKHITKWWINTFVIITFYACFFKMFQEAIPDFFVFIIKSILWIIIPLAFLALVGAIEWDRQNFNSLREDK